MPTNSKLPAALTPLMALNNWVGWRFEEVNGKRTKVPYQVRAPEHKASTKNPSTWASYQEASIAVSAFDGIGFCLQGTEIVAFDIDDCRDPSTQAIHPWAQQLIERAG